MSRRRRLTLARWLTGALVGSMLVWAVLRFWPKDQPTVRAAVLHRGTGAEAESLDPQAARSEAALTIARDLFEGLTAIDARGQPMPAAADTWVVSNNGRDYRFHIRAGARWSNGDALTAQDFVAAWRRLVDPVTAAPYAANLSMIENAADILSGKLPASSLQVDAAGPSELHVELARPVAYFLSLLAHPAASPLHRSSLAAYARRDDVRRDKVRSFAKPGTLISNGAFVAVRWDFGAKIVAARNRFYWNNAANCIDRVEYHAISEPSAELRSFRSGVLDLTATVPTQDLRWIQANLATQLHVSPQLALYYIGFNLRTPPFEASPKLRQALSMVIDREKIVTAVTGMGETPAYSLVPAGTVDYSQQLPEYAHWPLAQRIERARALLAHEQAPAEVELAYNSGELHQAIALAVASMWRDALGIRTRLRAEEFKVLLQDVQRGEHVQMFRASWVADYDDAYSFLSLFERGGINPPHYDNRAFDRLLAQANSQSDVEERRRSLQSAERMLLADSPIIPLYFYVNKHLVSPRVRGWRDNVLNIVYSKNLALAQVP